MDKEVIARTIANILDAKNQLLYKCFMDDNLFDKLKTYIELHINVENKNRNIRSYR